MLKQPVDILIVEDNEIDLEAAKRAFKKANIVNHIYSARDGVEALEMLNGEHKKITLSKPCIILLDINMPHMDGITLLKELSSHDSMQHNIVFMLTTSSRNEDCIQAYNFKIAGYIVKDHLSKLAEMLSIYCSINEFPTYTI